MEGGGGVKFQIDIVENIQIEETLWQLSFQAEGTSEGGDAEKERILSVASEWLRSVQALKNGCPNTSSVISESE